MRRAHEDRRSGCVGVGSNGQRVGRQRHQGMSAGDRTFASDSTLNQPIPALIYSTCTHIANHMLIACCGVQRQRAHGCGTHMFGHSKPTHVLVPNRCGTLTSRSETSASTPGPRSVNVCRSPQSVPESDHARSNKLLSTHSARRAATSGTDSWHPHLSHSNNKNISPRNPIQRLCTSSHEKASHSQSDHISWRLGIFLLPARMFRECGLGLR